jgi:polysaccharide deacetylase family protein (PEP-CTERM system associated)
MTERILEFLARRDIRGTFFIVGDIVESCPVLVRKIADCGHEVASHGHRHVALGATPSRQFKRGIVSAKHRLEDVAGRAVLGYRAPMFSLTPGTGWAANVLADAGFVYSSSIIPRSGVVRRFRSVPREPFFWPGGLLEIPCPVARVGPFWLPFMGGMYLRYLPPWRQRRMLRQSQQGALWVYCHPYDFDVDEPYGLATGRGVLASLMLWCNRRSMFPRVDRLLRGHSAMPFEARLDSLMASATPFEPEVDNTDRRYSWRRLTAFTRG